MTLIQTGKKQLQAKGNQSRPKLESTVTEEGEEIETEILDENSLKYKGETYRYKEDMVNLLFVGVDSSGEVTEEGTAGVTDTSESLENAGQADSIFLLALDNGNKTIDVIQINRDTMTDISIYGSDGSDLGKSREQIALSFAYGDGGQESAELTVEAVSNLLYGLPINGYCVLNTSAIPVVSDLVGGVEVTLLEDFTAYDPSYTKGASVVLTGDMTETYIRSRMSVGDGTNENRMARQKQYLGALAAKLLTSVKSDVTLPVTLFNAVSQYMVTDITVNEVSYMATQISGYTMPDDFIHSLEGTSVEGNPYMEFTVDEKILYELILDIFYEKA
jgi:LCP family protein required for cell wall assembly